MSEGNIRTINFWEAYGLLYRKAASVQKDYFSYSPAEKGPLFYALELCGETGELLNVCKKIIRTKDSDKYSRLVNKEFPEEAADCAIALTMLAQSIGDEPIQPSSDEFPSVSDLHPLLILLSKRTSALYAAAWENNIPSKDISLTLDLLFKISQIFTCDLVTAVTEKLNKIALRALEKHYD